MSDNVKRWTISTNGSDPVELVRGDVFDAVVKEREEAQERVSIIGKMLQDETNLRLSAEAERDALKATVERVRQVCLAMPEAESLRKYWQAQVAAALAPQVKGKASDRYTRQTTYGYCQHENERGATGFDARGRRYNDTDAVASFVNGWDRRKRTRRGGRGE